jgi:mannosyltransferase
VSHFNQSINRLQSRFNPAIMLVLLVLLLAAALRVYHIGTQSLWYDEGNSAAMVGRSIGQILTAAGGDIHPPLYYLLLAGWGAAAGKSELALRLPSALMGVLSVGVMYSLGKKLFDRRAGVIAAGLAAINPFQVYYGQEARMYLLVTLLSATSALLAAHVLTIPGEMTAGQFKPRRAGLIMAAYVLVNAAGLYTHYLFPVVLLAESALFAVWLIRRKQKLHGLITWIVIQVAAIGLFAPWIPTAIRQLEAWPRLTSGGVGAIAVVNTVALGTTLSAETALGGVGPMILLALVGCLPPIDHQRDRHYLRFSERTGLIGVWLILAVLIPALPGAIREPTLKFLLPANFALMLLMARGIVLGWEIGRESPSITLESGWLVRIVVLALVFFSLSPMVNGLQNLWLDPAYARDDYRAIAARIRAEAGPAATVILDAPGQKEVFTYYYPDEPGITPLPDGSPRKTIARLLADKQRLYAVLWGQSEQDPEGIVESGLQAGAFQVDATWYGKVQLVTYAVAGPPADSIGETSEAKFGPAIVLDGYTLSADSLSPGEALGVTLFWHTTAHIPIGYKVFVHVYKADGTILAQHDGEPDGGLKPTHQWQVGRRVADAHGLLIPVGTPPGSYRLAIGMYDADGKRLAVTLEGVTAADELPIGSLEIR